MSHGLHRNEKGELCIDISFVVLRRLVEAISKDEFTLSAQARTQLMYLNAAVARQDRRISP